MWDILKPEITNHKYIYKFLNGTEVDDVALDSIVSLMERMKHPEFRKMEPFLEKSSPYLRAFDRLDMTEFMYQVLVHTPYDFPETGRMIPMRLKDGSKLDLITAAEIWKPEYKFKYLPLRYRNCIYKTDPFTSLDGVYSFNGCHIKCRLELIFNRCKCAPYYFFNGPKPVCKLSQYWCLHLISRKEAFGRCRKCIPSCKRSLYNLLVRRSFTNPGNLSWVHHKDNNPYMMLSFSYMGSISYSKSFTSPTIPFGIIGGVMNLLLGCSIISFLEIFYFIIRAFLEQQHSRIIKLRKKKKAYPPLQPFHM